MKRHSQAEVWPEIIAGIREVGILEMEIYILENRLFMIVETPLDFEWDTAMEKLAGLPRQAEWEDYMSIFRLPVRELLRRKMAVNGPDVLFIRVACNGGGGQILP